jgi:hypothetical protein
MPSTHRQTRYNNKWLNIWGRVRDALHDEMVPLSGRGDLDDVAGASPLHRRAWSTLSRMTPSQSSRRSTEGSPKRLLVSLLISYLCCFVASYELAVHKCPGSILGIGPLIDQDWRTDKQLIGALFMGSFFIAMIVHDIISGIRFRCGLDSELNDLKLRPGHGGSYRKGNTTFPISRRGRFILYALLFMIAMLFVVHVAPRVMCSLPSSASTNTTEE